MLFQFTKDQMSHYWIHSFSLSSFGALSYPFSVINKSNEATEACFVAMVLFLIFQITLVAKFGGTLNVVQVCFPEFQPPSPAILSRGRVHSSHSAFCFSTFASFGVDLMLVSNNTWVRKKENLPV